MSEEQKQKPEEFDAKKLIQFAFDNPENKLVPNISKKLNLEGNNEKLFRFIIQNPTSQLKKDILTKITSSLASAKEAKNVFGRIPQTEIDQREKGDQYIQSKIEEGGITGSVLKASKEVSAGIKERFGGKVPGLGEPAKVIEKFKKQITPAIGTAIAKYADEFTLGNLDKIAGLVASTATDMPYEQAKDSAKKALKELYEKYPGGASIGGFAGFLSAHGLIKKGLGKIAPQLGKVSKIVESVAKTETAATALHYGLKAEKGNKVKEAALGAGTNLLLSGITKGVIGTGKITVNVSRWLGKKPSLLRSLGIEHDVSRRILKRGVEKAGSSMDEFHKIVPNIKTSKGKNIIEKGDSILQIYGKVDDAKDTVGDRVKALISELPEDKYTIPKQKLVKAFAEIKKFFSKRGTAGGEQATEVIENDLRLFLGKFKKDKVDVKELFEFVTNFRKEIRFAADGAPQLAKKGIANKLNDVVNRLTDTAKKAGDLSDDFLKTRKEFTLLNTFISSLTTAAKAKHLQKATKDLSDFLVTRRALITGGVGEAATIGAIGALGTIKLVTSRVNSFLAKGFVNVPPDAKKSMAQDIMATVSNMGKKYTPIFEDASKKGSLFVIATYMAMGELNIDFKNLANKIGLTKQNLKAERKFKGRK